MAENWREEHAPSFVGHGSHYSFLVDFGPDVDTRSVMRKLLRKRIGVVAGSMDSETLRVNAALKAVIKLQNDARKLDEFTSEISKESPSLLRLVRLSPSPAVLARILYTFTLALVRWKRRPPETQHDGDAWTSEISDRMKPVIAGLAVHIIDQMKLLGGRLDMERQLHTYAYRAADPYLRIALQRVFFESGSGESKVDGAIEISLMLHRTGICVVTMSVDSAETLNFEQAQRLMLPTWVEFESIQVSRPVADNFVGRVDRWRCRKYWEKAETAESEQWVTFHKENAHFPLNVTSLLQVYMQSICRVAGVDFLSWQSFSTVSLGPMKCGCGALDLESNHRHSLVSLLRGTSVEVNYREDVYTSHLRNLLPIEDGALYVSRGKAVLIDHTSDGPDFMRDLRQAVIATESALSQHGQLLQVDQLSTDAVVRDRNLIDAQRALTSGLLEYQRDVYVEDDLHTIVEALHSEMGTPKVYSRLLDRVGTMHSLVTSQYSRTQTRRSLFVSLCGLALVLILLMPRLSEALRALVDAGGYPASLILRIDEWTGGRGATTLAFYVVIVSLCALAILSVSIRWRGRKIYRQRRFGYSPEGFGIRADLGREQPPDQVSVPQFRT